MWHFEQEFASEKGRTARRIRVPSNSRILDENGKRAQGTKLIKEGPKAKFFGRLDRIGIVT
jgi:hypothetical protein